MKSFIVCILFASMVFAQENEGLKFFPYKTGDIWEYDWYDLEFPDTLQNFNIKHSVDADGNIFVTQSARFINPIWPPALLSDTALYRIDTSYNVFCLTCPIENQFLFKLNAQQGEQWVVHTYYDSIMAHGYEIARVSEVWEDALFGVQTIFKTYLYYYTADSTDTLGLVRYGVTLAKGFGVWWKGGGDAVGAIFLKGAIIDKVLYGDTTAITYLTDLPDNIPVQYELYPNYPNPFNPSTIIAYSIPQRSNVTLKIYDVLGKEITTLVNEQKEAGLYEIKYDASKLSSGVYIYSIQAGDFLESRKMILMK